MLEIYDNSLKKNLKNSFLIRQCYYSGQCFKVLAGISITRDLKLKKTKELNLFHTYASNPILYLKYKCFYFNNFLIEKMRRVSEIFLYM